MAHGQPVTTALAGGVSLLALPRPAPSRLARKRQAAQSLLKLAVTVATIHPERAVRLRLRLRLPAAASELEHGKQDAGPLPRSARRQPLSGTD